MSRQETIEKLKNILPTIIPDQVYEQTTSLQLDGLYKFIQDYPNEAIPLVADWLLYGQDPVINRIQDEADESFINKQ